MSRPGACWDNAVAESFFATVKVEFVRGVAWPSRATARRALFDYIESFYDSERPRSTLGPLSPLAFERQWRQQAAQ